MDFAGVDVEEEGAVRGEEAMGFEEAGAEEGEVVGEVVWVGGGLRIGLLAVGVAAEAEACGGGVTFGFDAGAALDGAGVKGGIDVDEVGGGVGELTEEGEVFALEDGAGGGGNFRFQGVRPLG